MSYTPDPKGIHAPFDIVRRGYDRDQVLEFLRRFDAELRLTATDRDAAAAQTNDLAAQLDDARDEIDQLRSEIDRLSVPPTTAEGMSDRISRMLRLASDEVAEMRARAESEAAEVVSVAEQDADEMRAAQQAKLSELELRRQTLEKEHQQTMTLAREHADKIKLAAQSERERLDAEAQARRDRTYEELRAHTEETKRIAAAEAERRITVATATASGRITQARADFNAVAKLRADALKQLMSVHGHLESIAEVHAVAISEKAPSEVDFDWYDVEAEPIAGVRERPATKDSEDAADKDSAAKGGPDKSKVAAAS
ncbi:DivIVA domain-containing protein [Tomitella biformata]|uniref:DivIVA domain-containing protein n=1 Tax=Tomitella biformata TaxID=630403 RepID=UPI00046484E1|nr:hypothetical protein [Tomitella biformata]